MRRLPAALLSLSILILAGCGATQDVAEDVGIVGDDDEVVTTQPQQVSATDAVPQGTVLNVRLMDTISPETANEGDTFRAQVTNDLYASNGEVLIPEGALLSGTITGIDGTQRAGDPAAVRLAFDEIMIEDRRYDLNAEIVETSVERRSRDVDAEHVGAGAAAGAALGVILGDDVGDALLGGAIGAGAGTLISLGSGEVEPEIPAGTVLALETDHALNI